ncbi:MAG: DUF4391 domain-containing protein [Candidatus Methanoperedens sp.]
MLFGNTIMFPKTTIIGKKIPKQRFYDNVELSTSLKNKFVEQIEGIVFANKFSKDTLNIPKTDEIEEVFVFDITLKETKFIDEIEDVLTVIDRSVPYPILYKFNIREFVVYKIAYKKRNQNDINKSVVVVYLTKKIPIDELDSFKKEIDVIFNALNMKILYENILKLFLHEQKGSVEESVEDEKNCLAVEKEIGRLEKLMIHEKQADKQFEIHNSIKKLRRKLK